MAYTSPWERLHDALERVMAATDLSQTEVQADICRAIADGAVKIRGKLDRNLTNPMRSPETVLEGAAFRISTDLKSEDLDWGGSRPTKAWIVRREVFKPPGPWALEWIELFRSDVTTVLCSAEKTSNSTPHTQHQTSSKIRSRPARERIERALKELYAKGVPKQADQPNKQLCRRVNEWLKNKGLPEAKNDTILRAAGRRK